jgi:hypothetical protein
MDNAYPSKIEYDFLFHNVFIQIFEILGHNALTVIELVKR